MSTKFFNNNGENTLFTKLKGIAHGMMNFDRFLAVVGFFRSSGYFKLRRELGDVSEIKILVGINVDLWLFFLIFLCLFLYFLFFLVGFCRGFFF